MDDSRKHVKDLIKKAAEADKSEDAMRYSQAAQNAANAMAVLSHMDQHTHS